MMIVVMVLSAVMIGATGVAGILTARQIRQTADAGNFSKVLFAADSGLEWGEYMFYNDKAACDKIDCPSDDNLCLLWPEFNEIGLKVKCSNNIITSSATYKNTSYVFSKKMQ